jgi:hypothetical protein
MAANQSEPMQAANAAIESASKEKSPAHRLSILVEKANGGKENGPQVKELRKFLNEHEDLATRPNFVAYSLQRTIMQKVTPGAGDLELFEREYEKRRDDLGRKDASAIERLMIERIMLLWVRLLWCENYNAGFMKGGAFVRQSEFADKQYTRAHTRYVKALESLAKLRQVQAVTKAADAQASILEMKEKTTRARINANNPNVLSGNKGLHEVRQKRA